MEYWMVTTTDDKGNKALGGGMMKRVQPGQQITNYINVRSVDEYSEKVEKLGGRVVATKHAVPGMATLQFASIPTTIVLPYGNLAKPRSDVKKYS